MTARSPLRDCPRVCAATHAIISLAASAYALVHSNTARCEGREFCHDDMSARLMTASRASLGNGCCGCVEASSPDLACPRASLQS